MAATATEEQGRLGAIVAGRYRLLRVLGRGGMGIVYEAETVSPPKRRVAIKIMHPENQLNEENVKRFKNEGANAGRVKHPNIVELIEAGQDADGSLYIVLELLRGTDLSSYLVRYGKMEPRDAIVVAAQVLHALSVAHTEEIVHRDIKPENIFLTKGAQGDAHVKIVDFGISKAINPEKAFVGSVTQINTTVGTPHYMSPEQARGEAIDPRADLWALGVVLYESLTGHLPFDGDNFNTQIVAVVTEPHMPATAYGVDRALSDIIDRCLQKDRNQRFRDAREMLDALRRYATEAPAVGLADSPIFEEANTAEWRVPEVRKAVEAPARDRGAPDEAMEAAPVFPGMVSFDADPAADSAPTKLRALDRSLVRPMAPVVREPEPAAAPVPVTAPITSLTPPPVDPLDTSEDEAPGPNPMLLIVLALVTALVTGTGTYFAYQHFRGRPEPSRYVRLHFVNLPPGAQVSVGGRGRGASPDVSVERRHGTAQVVITATGFQPLLFPVSLEQDQNITLPALIAAPPPALQAPVALPDAAPSLDVAPPTAARVVTRQAPAPTPAIALGPPTPDTFLQVGGIGCMVSIDGATISAAPVMHHPVSAGRHRVECARNGAPLVQMINAPAGQTTSVRF